MDLNLKGLRVLVTAGASGIGLATARAFANEGARVHVCDVDEGHLAALAKHAPGVTSSVCDVSDPAAVARLFETTQERLGGLDALVNNAGRYPLAGLLEMTADEWNEVLAANLASALACLQAAGRRMAAAGGGAIVNVTSIQAFRAAPELAHYSAAKAGLEMLTRSAAVELGRAGVRVNTVAPGLIWREGIETAWPDGVARFVARAPLGRLGQPHDVADACLFLASPAARFVTGATLVVDGGVLAAPAF